MKKLMIAAVAAAIVGGAYAIPSTGEQAYSMCLTVKTTVPGKGTIKDVVGECDFDSAIAYRKQASKKIEGLIWGCWCDTLNDPHRIGEQEYAGYVFWNVTDKYQYDDIAVTTFDWLNGWDWTTQIDRINKDGKKSEGIWRLVLARVNGDNSETEYNLTGAGFGTAAGSIVSEARSMIYVPKMSGYFVGTRLYTCSEAGHCGEGTKEGVVAWPLCQCGETPEKTVAYGTWNIKFNNSVATKFAKTGDITTSYKFPSYVSTFDAE